MSMKSIVAVAALALTLVWVSGDARADDCDVVGSLALALEGDSTRTAQPVGSMALSLESGCGSRRVGSLDMTLESGPEHIGARVRNRVGSMSLALEPEPGSPPGARYHRGDRARRGAGAARARWRGPNRARSTASPARIAPLTGSMRLSLE
jgi:hypothetical protein